MAKFAAECLAQFSDLVAQLELELGPGTCELGIRTGLHSGPVTAGVLRGEKGRFQLFGDTVNTAARMETTGLKNRIHMSQEYVDLLRDAGKDHWVNSRDDSVVAKGKGILNTYWLETEALDLGCARSVCSGVTDDSSGSPTGHFNDSRNGVSEKPTKKRYLKGKHKTLVDWNTNIMKSVLGDVEARRQAGSVVPDSPQLIYYLERQSLAHRTSLDQVKEIVCIPEFNADATKNQEHDKVVLGDNVLEQLHSYIGAISEMYSDENPFHNFHVSSDDRKIILDEPKRP